MVAETDPPNAESGGLLEKGGMFLTFTLATEQYGLEILRIVEIIGMLQIIPLPNTPASLRGVVTLRDRVIPVVDLRTKFGLPEAEPIELSCIIVAELGGQSVGLVVDGVSEVIEIPGADIDPPPRFEGGANLLGIGKVEGQVKLLVNLDRIFSADEQTALESMAAERGR